MLLLALISSLFTLYWLSISFVSSGPLNRLEGTASGPGNDNGEYGDSWWSFPIPHTSEQKLRIFVVADLDKNAKVKGPKGDLWISYLKQGTLTIHAHPDDDKSSTASIVWDDSKTRTIESSYSFGGRGMELSTLNKYNGKLVSCDDRTGIIFELPIDENSLTIKAVPWVILADVEGGGNQLKFTSKGFKCEWAVIKNGDLWVGGHGVTKGGKDNEKYVRVIGPDGTIKEVKDWTANYVKMDEKLGIKPPGYVTHEAAGWSNQLQKWVFMPRKVSPIGFKQETDDKSSSNTVILADESFNNIEVTTIGKFEETHGFSSFKFIPGTMDQVFVAVKSLEQGAEGETTASFAMISDFRNHTLVPETKFADKKYEGIEFFRRR